jgi:hypothetical protein
MAAKPQGSTALAKKSAGTALATMDFNAELDALKSRLLKPAGDKIKISNKQFKLPSGDILDFLDVVILDFVYFNTYYEGDYDPNKIVPPNCFALSAEQKDMSPSANVPDCQSDCGTCQGCWANEFGSSGKGKACQNRVLMAILPTDATEETPFSILDISPTAIKGFSAYVASVASGLRRPPYGVVTHIECNPATKHDVAIFSDPQPIEDEAFIALLRSRKQEARERLLTEPDVSAFKAANDTPKKGALKAPVKRRA